MARNTWFLIADAARARLFVQQHGGTWRLVQTFSHTRSSAKGRDILADKPGRVQQSVGDGRRSAADPSTDPKAVEAERFARELAEALEAFLHDQAAARLMLVAPPRFLGRLREALGTTARAHLAGTVARDLSRVAERDLPAHLAKAVA